MISPLIWVLLFFVILCFISMVVYILVVKFFYWGDKKEPRKKVSKPENS
jgi:NADH:ubiquinone oxidoreductase subunit 2 (subunit N)